MGGQVQSVGIPSVFGQYGTQVVYKLANVLLGPATVINFNSGANATLENDVLTIDISGASSINVVDNLLSTSATDALSANQGNVIFISVQLMYTQFGNSIDDIYTTLSSYGDIVTHNASEFITPDSLSTSLSTKADLVGGFVPANQLPSFVDDVLEFANLASFPVTGEAGKLYIAIDTNLVYRWTGSIYAVTSSSLALGESSATAYRGDRGKLAYDHSQATGNPHNTAISDVVGLQTAIDNAAVNFATPTPNSQSGTAYTLGTVATDNDGKTYLRMTNAAANTVTIPSTQTKPISISQRGAGITTLVAGAGVTLNGILTFDAQHQTKTVIPLGGNIFDVVG